MDKLFYLIPFFLIIAIIYSSVGFGGGSSYLAIMALIGLPYQLMPKISLFCNIIVVTAGCYIFIKHKHLKIKKAVPFIAASIPMAFFGGNIYINKELFLFLLGLTLIVAATNMLFFNRDLYNINQLKDSLNIHNNLNIQNKKFSIQYEILAGGIIGLLSGLVGIGGGILLAPLLHITKWGKPKEIAAVSSFFILINSISGLIGQFSKPWSGDGVIPIVPLIIVVFFGGQIGSRMSAGILSESIIKKTTAFVVMFVGLRILYGLI